MTPDEVRWQELCNLFYNETDVKEKVRLLLEMRPLARSLP